MNPSPRRLSFSNPAVAIGGFVILLFVIGLALAWFGRAPKSAGPIELGDIGAACGGTLRLPCKPGGVCSVAPDRWDEEEGICQKDLRPAPKAKSEGETCGGANEQCGWGLVCTDGVCKTMSASNKPFILAVIPEGMTLVSGSYRAAPGTEVTVNVRATNVSAGTLYLKPMTSSKAGVGPDEKVADLVPTGIPNEYSAKFTVTENLGADLIAVMKGVDGQEVTLGVNVSSDQ